MKKLILFLLLAAPLMAQTVVVGGGGGTSVNLLSPGPIGTTTPDLVDTSSLWGPVQQQNTQFLRNTWAKIAGMKVNSPTRLRCMIVADSVAGFHATDVCAGLRDATNSSMGPNTSANQVGIMGCTSGPLATGVSSSCQTATYSGGAAASTGDFTRSPLGKPVVLPVGGCAVFAASGGNFLMDTIHVYYTVGGTMTIATGSGSTWTTQSTVDTSTIGSAGGIASVSLGSATSTQVQVCSTSGTVYLGLPPHVYNTTASGVDIENLSLGGLGLDQLESTPSAVLQPWLNDLAPDLFVYEMKEIMTYTDGSTYLQRMTTLANDLVTANAYVDGLLIQSSPLGSNDSDQIAQNGVLRQIAKTYNWVTWDGYYPSLNYATELGLGKIASGEGTHQNYTGQAADANALLAWLGLGAPNLKVRQDVNNSLTTTNTLELKSGMATPQLSCATSGLDAACTTNRGLLLKDTSGNTYGVFSNASDQSGNFINYQKVTSTSGAGWVMLLSNRVIAPSTNQSGTSLIGLRAMNYSLNPQSWSTSGAVTPDFSKGHSLVYTLTGAGSYSSYSNNLDAGAVHDPFINRICVSSSSYQFTYGSGWTSAVLGPINPTASQCTTQYMYFPTSGGPRPIGPAVSDDGTVLGTYFGFVNSNYLGKFASGTLTAARTWTMPDVTGTVTVSGAASGVPSISSGFGTSPSIATATAGTQAFRVTVGTGGTATSGVLTLPTATTAWNCFVSDITNPGANFTKESASTTTSVTLTNYNSSGTATAWTASDVLAVSCFAY